MKRLLLNFYNIQILSWIGGMTCLWSIPCDVIIPCGPKDCHIVSVSIESIRRYVPEVRRIIVVSPERYTDQAEWFDERVLPFDSAMIMEELLGKYDALVWKKLKTSSRTFARPGWFLQQFIKLYAIRVIPDLLDQILVVDADVIFLKPYPLFNEEGKVIVSKGTDYLNGYPYRSFVSSVLGVDLIQPSYIVHHMVIQREVLEHLFFMIEHKYQQPVWKALIQQCTLEERGWTQLLSEFQLYQMFVTQDPNAYEERTIQVANCGELFLGSLFQKEDFDLLACHWFIRSEATNTMLENSTCRLDDFFVD